LDAAGLMIGGVFVWAPTMVTLAGQCPP